MYALGCFSRAWLFLTLQTVAHQAPLSMGFSRWEYWSGLPHPTSGDIPDTGIKPISPAAPALQMDSLLLSHWESPRLHFVNLLWNRKKIMPQGADQKSFALPSLVAQMIKNLPVIQEIPGLGRYPGEGNSNPLQYSCLENPMNRGVWEAIVHGVTKIQTWLNTTVLNQQSNFNYTHPVCILNSYTKISLCYKLYLSNYLESAYIFTVSVPLKGSEIFSKFLHLRFH